ncbi:hypothetical protein D0T12_32250 [Actinomadura spongiicola]|uniref:AMIN-like domain-containing protein n=1 Tax=Actinomadura spongiicola TaxID=2303421 RepID=A0A372G8A8_9ACTN|nr:hypothetical protein [Actinomadura spongiicola]RFS81313.1 hypothetical protein D0T12_32250 [Actinomadura spongiicola]
MRALVGGLLTLVVSAVLVGVLGTSASAACDTPWGSQSKGTLGDYSQGPLERVRTGRQTCYDRLVIEVAGSRFGYLVGYVDEVHQEGSGKPVPLRGGAKIRIIVQAAAAPGFPAVSPELANVSGYTTFRQVAGAASFEGQTTIGLGVRARLPFRVLALPREGGGTRLVVDVAHAW